MVRRQTKQNTNMLLVNCDHRFRISASATWTYIHFLGTRQFFAKNPHHYYHFMYDISPLWRSELGFIYSVGTYVHDI